jgi:hypothetical protein
VTYGGGGPQVVIPRGTDLGDAVYEVPVAEPQLPERPEPAGEPQQAAPNDNEPTAAETGAPGTFTGGGAALRNWLGESMYEDGDRDSDLDYLMAASDAPRYLDPEDFSVLSERDLRPADAGDVGDIDKRINDAERMLGVISVLPDQPAKAQKFIQELAKAITNRDLERIQLYLESIKDDYRGGGRRSPSRDEIPTVEANLAERGVAATFDLAMGSFLGPYPEAKGYAAVIRQMYQRRETMEVGASPRRTDGLTVAKTNSMRSQFLRCSLPDGDTNPVDPVAAALRMTPWELVDAAAVELVRNHLASAIHRGGADAAVARGDAVWVNAATGERLVGRAASAVLWPATRGEAWEMDHGIELRHGGHDFVDNYVPAPKSFHAAKTRAMDQFSAGVWNLREWSG